MLYFDTAGEKFVLKASSIINNLIGNVPLSAGILPMKQLIGTFCNILFIHRILKGLEDMIGNILRQIINKILNSAECLVNLFSLV